MLYEKITLQRSQSRSKSRSKFLKNFQSPEHRRMDGHVKDNGIFTKIIT